MDKNSVLSQGDINATQKLISKAVDAMSDKSHQCRKSNFYSPEQHVKTGRYAMDNDATCTAKHYNAVLDVYMNESTARRLKSEYLKKLEQQISKQKDQHSEDTTTRIPIVIKTLETEDRGTPLVLGEKLDAAVQEFVNNLRVTNGVVNRAAVMGTAEGIVSCRDIPK